jgi:hypothetical protein
VQKDNIQAINTGIETLKKIREASLRELKDTLNEDEFNEIIEKLDNSIKTLEKTRMYFQGKK